MTYKPVKNLPVAKFYYKGNHSHPIRRTVVITESRARYFRGYEVREGSVVRDLKDAPIKSYNKKKIATQKELGRCKHRNPGPEVTTLTRACLFELLTAGA